jgi:monofunctional biosynthetic peptidoglycan transglycosylase
MRKPLRRPVLVAAVVAGAILLALASTWATLPDVSWLATKNPPTTALIDQRRAEARAAKRAFRVRQRWVTLKHVSPRLVDAVVLSEDARFYAHGGFDWQEIRSAAEKDLEERRFVRGASTITQQLAKNLFLGSEKTLTRKLKEAMLAAKIEKVLTKRRILTLYLNVVEWGRGIFGIEAAARAHFQTSAAGLTTAQACLLAAMLPSPQRGNPGSPSARLRRYSRIVLDRMLEAGRIGAPEHSQASAELERILAGPEERRLLQDLPREEEPQSPAIPRDEQPSPATSDEPSPSEPPPPPDQNTPQAEQPTQPAEAPDSSSGVENGVENDPPPAPAAPDPD